ncbi:MATE family efflux transporter [Embleya sp. AB8]|uniref:MATE family efflux transporter n=1 Tax=Embleya sp. AB8 TaxID=3156304 RepID=UPI003C773AA4
MPIRPRPGGETRALVALAAPLAVTQVAQVALTTTDLVMMGALGAGALAAGGLAIVVFNQLRTMGVGMVTALGNQIAAARVTAALPDPAEPADTRAGGKNHTAGREADKSDAGAEVGPGIGLGAGSGADVGIGPGADLGVGPGVDVGVGPGVDVGFGPGVGKEVGPGSGLGAGAEAGAQVGAEVAAEGDTEAGARVGAQVGAEAGAEGGPGAGAEAGPDIGAETGARAGAGAAGRLGTQAAPAARRAANVATDDPHAALRELVRAGLAVATLAGLAGILLMAAIAAALPLLGQSADVVHRARPMILALAPGLLPCLWFQVIRQYTVGMRRPQALLGITIASVAANIALNWCFIHGVWFVPDFGLVGIGLSTTLVYGLSLLALHAAVRRDPVLAPALSLAAWRADPATVRRLAKLGFPIAATYGSEAGFFSVVALIMGGFGAAALAAHTAVNQLVYIVFQITVGISHASSVLVSEAIAQRRPARARVVARTALALGASVMAVVALLYLVLPRVVLTPFLDPDDPATSTAIHLLAIAALLQFFDTSQNIGVGLLRGLDDTSAGFRMTVIGYWLVGLPIALLVGVAADTGPTGVWIGLCAGLAATAGLLLRRFRAGLDRTATR